FLEQSEVDPIYFESSFLALPDEKADKPYILLLPILEETNKMGVAKVTMHQREYTIFIRARNHGLTLHTMYYQNEIAAVAGYGKNYDIKVKPEEVRLAEQLVESLTSRFKPEAYKDEFQARLQELIEAKLEGKTLTPTPKREKAPVIDMMEALKRSLGEGRRAAGGGAKARPARGAAAGGHRQHRKAS